MLGLGRGGRQGQGPESGGDWVGWGLKGTCVCLFINQFGLAISAQRGEKGVGAAGWGEGGRGHSCQAVPMGKGAVTSETWPARPSFSTVATPPLAQERREIREEEEPQGGESYPVTAPASGRGRSGEEKLPASRSSP